MARLVRTGDRRLLLAIGAATGLGLENKTLLGLPVFALLIGLLWVGPRQALRGRWLPIGIAVALLLWAPNLIWQAQHGFPHWAWRARSPPRTGSAGGWG